MELRNKSIQQKGACDSETKRQVGLVLMCVDDLQGQGGFCELQARLLVDIICLGFQRAFDKTPHEKLLKKLGFNGIGGEVLL